MKVAIVHDLLLRLGGAERVVLALRQIFPQAPIYTLLYDRQKMAPWFDNLDVRTSWLQKIPAAWRRNHKYLLSLMPLAIEGFDLGDFDLVISSSTAFAKGVITRAGTKHLCYCHGPARFLWEGSLIYLQNQELGWCRRQLARRAVHKLRLWDRSSARRVDHFVANSQTTQARLQKYYRRQAEVIYPPVPDWSVSANFLRPPQKDYFLIVAQLARHKNIDLAVEAFNKLELPLVIIGEGPEKKRLQKIAKPNIQFLGFLPDQIVAGYLQNARAFIFPGEDDLGIAPVQAMRAGKPVLALRAGGATETVLEGVAGEFFDDPVPEVLADGVRRLLEKKYDPDTIKASVGRFSVAKFEREMKNLVEKIMNE